MVTEKKIKSQKKKKKVNRISHRVHLVKKKETGNKTKNQVSLICLQINSSKHKNKQIFLKIISEAIFELLFPCHKKLNLKKYISKALSCQVWEIRGCYLLLTFIFSNSTLKCTSDTLFLSSLDHGWRPFYEQYRR